MIHFIEQDMRCPFKGSMELLAERDPEGARKILDAVIERITEALHRYEGTVNQVPTACA